MQWNDEYKKYFNDVITRKLSRSFLAMYEKSNWLHDWYLKNFYIANTGTHIQSYSAKGSSSLQMEFTSGGKEKNILLIYKNLYELYVDYKKSDYVPILAPTGFGECITNIFKIEDDTHICHQFEFVEGTIHIGCESIGYRKIINDYWK